MKRFITSIFALLCSSAVTHGATIRVDGIIEGRGTGPVGTTGETMDYLKFEVLTTSVVQIVGTDIGGRLLHLAAFIGREDTFGFIDNPFRLIDNYPSPTPPVLERILEAGTYVVAVDDDEDSSYDWGDGFKAVNVEGGSFFQSEYSFEVRGEVRGLEFWEGQLDPQPFGSFRITAIPEPGVAVLSVSAASFSLLRRRRLPAAN